MSGPYTPLFSGCHTILRRRLEEDSDSDSQSDSDDKSEFDDPESWPDIFDDIDLCDHSWAYIKRLGRATLA